LVQVVFSDFHLCLLERRLLGQTADTPDRINEAVQMLQTAAKLGGELTDCGYNMERFVERVKKVRQSLDDSVAKRSLAASASNMLPSAASCSAACSIGKIRVPRVTFPTPVSLPMRSKRGVSGTVGRSTTALSSFPSPLREARLLTPDDVETVITWISHDYSASHGHLHLELMLSEIERLFFMTAASGRLERTAASWEQCDLAMIVDLVDRYKCVLDTLRGTEIDSVTCMAVELRSREVLVRWIAYAIVYASARVHGPMAKYGVSLQPNDLRHLVLSDKLAVDAALNVADFLRQNTREGKAIFTLADSGRATFSFAKKVARRNTTLQSIYRDEMKAAKNRKNRHWSEVQHKRAERLRLRSEIEQLNETLAYQEEHLRLTKAARDDAPGSGDGECRRNVNRPWRYGFFCDCTLCSEVRNADDACSSTKTIISSKRAEFEGAEHAAPVVQPIPEDESMALQVLFFLHMPETFRILSKLSFQAQQALLPRKWDGTLRKAVDEPETQGCWASYYNRHQQSCYNEQTLVPRGESGDVELRYVGDEARPETRVDACGTPAHGVWYPDVLAPGCMRWKGGGVATDNRGKYFNPFSSRVQASWIVEEFTEQLPMEDRGSLQKYMPQHGFHQTSRDRGNLAIADQG
ncbi:unnamed protein product, partial [Sphacelaria rigidula]